MKFQFIVQRTLRSAQDTTYHFTTTTTITTATVSSSTKRAPYHREARECAAAQGPGHHLPAGRDFGCLFVFYPDAYLLAEVFDQEECGAAGTGVHTCICCWDGT